MSRQSHRSLRIALAGNPNCGKTTLFNGLTGARQKVGNYPGVTVEKREGAYVDARGRTVQVVDLPGSYSLTSYSPEEVVAQNELLTGALDVVVVVADSTNLSRSLVILAQLMHLRVRLLLALNMSDEARAAGQRLDLDQLRALLGFDVVETVGHRRQGIEDLREAIELAADGPVPPRRLVLGERLEAAIAELVPLLGSTELEEAAHEWYAAKLLVDDGLTRELVAGHGIGGQAAIDAAKQHRERIEKETGVDIALFVTERYYGFVDGLLCEVTLRRARSDARALSDRIDAVLAHRVLGLPFFFAAMYLIFWVTFTVGQYPMDWIEAGFDALAGAIGGLWAEGTTSPLRSLLIDGVIRGVGGVIVFLPNIVLLFLGLALLEDTGYMARAAHLTDALMHRFGLHGRSFIPLLTGFGCSVPGIMATRTLENERDRLVTMLVLPLMSCGARLPIWMLLVPAFFPAPWRAPVLWGIYMVGILAALLVALLLRRSVFRGEEAPFVMELPPYRLPTLRSLVSKMLERSWVYLRKAGTTILAISILMWAAAAFPRLERAPVDEAVAAGRVVVADSAAELEAARRNAPPGVEVITAATRDHRRQSERLQYSVAGRIGRLLEPALSPLGLDWRVGTALIGAFAAKEVFVAQMGIVYSMGEVDESSTTLRAAIRRDISPLAGVALILLLLMSAPCMATIAVTRRESGSWKWAALQLGGLTALGYLVALLIYQVGSLFGVGG